MENYLSFAEIQNRCEKLKDNYQIDEDKFYEIVENWAEETEISTEQKLIASFFELLQQVSNEITSMEEEVELQATCRMGCAFCCYFPIIVNGMEAKFMKKAIDKFPVSRRNEIQQHLTRYYQKYGEKLEELTVVDFEEDEDFKLNYRKSLVPCPLLDTETNKCLAYEIRPIPCRTYMNYTDPNVCEQHLMPKETISFEFLYGEYMGALNEFLQFLYEEGDTAFIEYPNDVYTHDYLVNWLKEEQ
ncbi:YkgJ family cysteine cluster protein [Ornithinibacillus sp. L9]|uniref:YkgJ family cysteine cluster protein n=1 Tax=Ornithinibacillus caprae TaxID=2678566 RepID=A0A6N8FH55_9BACI|nr:YkgJ family cysteine cluster protein [Ornithinibacillus caprae]MUK88026.1 YkgJ family cysteine cluster protein [Ornithinibacillus caprae]